MKAILVVIHLGTILAIWWSLLDARKLKRRHEGILDEFERQIEETDRQAQVELTIADMRSHYPQESAS